MWLIDAQTLKLKSVIDPRQCKYAILSHTWGDDEVTFEDMKTAAIAKKKKGYIKIKKTCERALKQGIFLTWIDTCCIDKSSSAELSESINSMFLWYKLSIKCYVWLEDWEGSDSESMRQSIWFTRGWTLQELIAPPRVEFLNRDWKLCGDRSSFGDTISSVTGVDMDVLQGRRPLSKVPVGRKMSWAASRKTTRMEDRAYSLLGIFDVNMPMLYGEGEKAFLRLQEEISKTLNDLSLFAWEPLRLPKQNFWGILAPSPDCFQGCGTLIVQNHQLYSSSEFEMTNKGLQIYTSLVTCKVRGGRRKEDALLLWCHKEEQPEQTLAVPLTRSASGYVRSNYGSLGLYPSVFPLARDVEQYLGLDFEGPDDPGSILITKMVSSEESDDITNQALRFLRVTTDLNPGTIGVWAKGFPPARWYADRWAFHLAGYTEFVGVVVLTFRKYVDDVGNFKSEIQIACGYCEELGGCWACLVPKHKAAESNRMERLSSYLVSRLRELDDAARTNSWNGYHELRNHIISLANGENSSATPVKTRLRTEGRVEWYSVPDNAVTNENQAPDTDVQLKCRQSDAEIPQGEILVILFENGNREERAVRYDIGGVTYREDFTRR